MKRVDFDPEGDRHPETRGVSGYERISWDEALDLVSGEIMRVRREHGPGAVFTAHGSHHTWGTLGYFLSAHRRFFNTIGHTRMMHNPDSWEGWCWGAAHHWGHSMRAGGGEFVGTVEDLLKECELVVFWASDPEATTGIYAGMEGTVRRQWLKDLGVPCVHIDPFLNHTAGWMGGKWMAPRPTTSVALAHAIAWVWVTEDLYDHEYVAQRTTGFEQWRDHLLGVDDGVPKTPEWQESETGVPAREVRALARDWAAKRTYLACGGPGQTFGGACRSATGIEWARSMVYLMAMQGLGKPGVNMGNLQCGAPVDLRFYFPGYSEGGLSGDLEGTMMSAHLYQRVPQLPTMNPVGQTIPRLRIPEAILDGHTESYAFSPTTVQGQFRKVAYPEPGYSPIRLYYKYGSSFIGTMTDTNRYVRAYRSPDVECVVNQSIWFEGEAKFADVILPACTNYERWDISEWANSSGMLVNGMSQCNHRVVVLQHKCIEPLGESRSDWRIFADLAARMGLAAPYRRGEQRAGVGAPDVRGQRPAEARLLAGVPEEGLLRRPAAGARAASPGRVPLVRRGPAQGHARPAAAAGRLRRPLRRGAADAVGQDRVRLEQPDALRPRRPRAAADEPVHGRRGRGRPMRNSPAATPATGLAAPALQPSHAGGRQGQLGQRRRRPPRPGRRALLLDRAAERGGRSRAPHP